MQGKCAALLGWDPSSMWDTPPVNGVLRRNGTIRTSISHGSLILAAERLQSAQLPCRDRGSVRPPVTTSALGGFPSRSPAWPALCTGGL